ncbi:MAG: hypothetical protein LBV64_03035 [Mediterranea sp.]|jgi:hypothetical protein|nr:hypothetical protein [Mediterranea sp.]
MISNPVVHSYKCLRGYLSLAHEGNLLVTRSAFAKSKKTLEQTEQLSTFRYTILCASVFNPTFH